MGGSGIDWPKGPYRVARDRAALAVALVVALIAIAGSAVSAAWLADNDQVALRDAAAWAGFGDVQHGARVSSVLCERSLRRGRVYYYCDVSVSGLPSPYEYEVYMRRPLDLAEANAVVRLGDDIAVAWDGPVILHRLFGLLMFGTIALLFTAGALWVVWLAARRGPFAAEGTRLIDADLLRREVRPHWTQWEFAFDGDGGRRFGRGLVKVDPLIADGVVTRGAILVTRKGKALLVTRDMDLVADPAARKRMLEAVAQHFNAIRGPLDPGFADLIAGTPKGPERDYVAAFGRAWHATRIADVNAAIEDRHRAAFGLSLEQVDALLRACRRFIVSG